MTVAHCYMNHEWWAKLSETQIKEAYQIIRKQGGIPSPTCEHGKHYPPMGNPKGDKDSVNMGCGECIDTAYKNMLVAEMDQQEAKKEV